MIFKLQLNKVSMGCFLFFPIDRESELLILKRWKSQSGSHQSTPNWETSPTYCSGTLVGTSNFSTESSPNCSGAKDVDIDACNLRHPLEHVSPDLEDDRWTDTSIRQAANDTLKLARCHSQNVFDYTEALGLSKRPVMLKRELKKSIIFAVGCLCSL